MRVARLLAVLCIGDAAMAQHATPHVSGYAYAVDAATLKLGSVAIRLAGVEAPPLDSQLPDRNGQSYPAGLFARDVLASLVAEHIVGCRPLKPPMDPAELVAVCASPAAPDLALAMLRRGWVALSERDGKPEVPGYAPAQAEARQHRRGLWQNGGTHPFLDR
jgi:endonuclease YncB( thermonuclease family)